jgi:hypothetical protein
MTAQTAGRDLQCDIEVLAAIQPAAGREHERRRDGIDGPVERELDRGGNRLFGSTDIRCVKSDSAKRTYPLNESPAGDWRCELGHRLMQVTIRIGNSSARYVRLKAPGCDILRLKTMLHNMNGG